MICKGNPYNNFMSADASGDKKLKRDILLSAIAEIIVNKPALVRKHLASFGFDQGNGSLRALSNAVSAALNKSPRFATRMAHEILGGNYGAEGTMDGGTITPVAEPVASPTPTPAPETTTGTVVPTNTTQNPAPSGNTAPLVAEMGTTFGGNVTKTGPAPTPAPVVDSQQKPQVYIVAENAIPGGGGGGFGGGGGGGAADLADKVDALSTDVTVNVKKVIGITLLVAAAISTYYYFNKNKKK